MLTAVDELGRNFDIDLLLLKNSALTKVQVRTPEATAALIDALIDLTRDAMDADNFEIALPAAARAEALPKSVAEATLAIRTSDLKKEAMAVKDEYLQV